MVYTLYDCSRVMEPCFGVVLLDSAVFMNNIIIEIQLTKVIPQSSCQIIG